MTRNTIFMFILIIILKLKLIWSFESSNFISDETDVSQRRAACDCIINIAKVSFPERTILITSLATGLSSDYKTLVHTDRLLLEQLHRESKWSIFVNKDKKGLKFANRNRKKADNYILQVRNIMEFKKNFNQLQILDSWNPHAKFVVFLNAVVRNSKSFISFFIQMLWEKMARNAIIMIHDFNDPMKLYFYTWYPYAKGHCGNQFNDPSIVGECYQGNITKVVSALFPEKIPSNLNGCPITVQTFELTPYIIYPDVDHIDEENAQIKRGLEVLLLEVIANKLNFTTRYRISSRNTSLEYALTQLDTRHADISVGAIAPDDQRHKVFDHTHTYWEESLAWTVPASIETPRWKNFIFSFKLDSWAIIAVAYILCSVFMRILSNFTPNEHGTFKTLFTSFLWLYSILINMPIPTETRTTKLRFVLMAWIIFSFIVNVTFQTFLMSVLTRPTYEKQINTFEELIDSSLLLGIIEIHRRFYMEDPKYVKIVNTTINCDDVGPCLFDVTVKRKMAVALPRLFMAYNMHRYIDGNGRPLIYQFEKDIVNYPIEMLMRKGFPLLQRINHLILSLKETGLMQKWRNDYMDETDSKEQELVPEDNETTEKSLTLMQTQVAFLVLGIGLGIASVSFMLELVHQYW